MKTGMSTLIIVGLMANIGPTIVSFAVPKPQDETDIKEQLETYRLLNKYKPIIMMMYVMNMIVDFVVCTVTMITLRRSIKKVTTRTAKFLRQYAILCVEGMALPFVASIAAMIMHQAGPGQSSLDVSAIWPMHKLALVSLFCLLLNRDTFREKLYATPHISFELCAPVTPIQGSIRVDSQVETAIYKDDYRPKNSANRPLGF
ncbi:hypothetical protein FFLO_01039 [Filobasidium floriforme]|uniref:Uncharacterized protein n=2 Tax=Filobasidium floriforme TaxID=5210 RepID=A0A8K0NQF9_9TREE|nr:hypothetical protein FFLO_01039 [Filobasidium floriforme]